jgi:hypothetical protein
MDYFNHFIDFFFSQTGLTNQFPQKKKNKKKKNPPPPTKTLHSVSLTFKKEES